MERNQAHQAGEPHCAIHIWCLMGSRVLLQKRSTLKKAFPGYWDCSVAGHIKSGESLADSLREAHEELGLELKESELVTLSPERIVHWTSEFYDREWIDEYTVKKDFSLEDCRFNDGEVEAVTRVHMQDLFKLCFDSEHRVPVSVFDGRDYVEQSLSYSNINPNILRPSLWKSLLQRNI